MAFRSLLTITGVIEIKDIRVLQSSPIQPGLQMQAPVWGSQLAPFAQSQTFSHE